MNEVDTNFQFKRWTKYFIVTLILFAGVIFPRYFGGNCKRDELSFQAKYHLTQVGSIENFFYDFFNFFHICEQSALSVILLTILGAMGFALLAMFVGQLKKIQVKK